MGGGTRRALAAGLLGLLAFTSGEAEAQAPRKGGTVVFAMGGDPVTLNRNVSSNNADGLVACAIYQGLTRINGAGDVKPMLARAWTISPDGKTYEFLLNKANWQDGQPFTSEDVKYTLLEISAKYSAVFSGAGRVIDTIETPSPQKAVIRLKEPYGPLLLSLACPQGGAILPKHLYEGTNPLQNPTTTQKPVGLGPFMLKEWKRGDYIRLVKNPTYWEPGKPYLDEIVAKVIPQPSARTQALLTGEIDFIMGYFFAPNDFDAVKASPKLQLRPANIPPGIDILFLNVTRKPLDDRRVRQALMMATDRDLLFKTAFLGVGGVGTMPFTNGIKWAADPNIDYRKMYPYDVAKANALLDEAGVKRGADGIRFKMDILFSSDDPEPPLVIPAIKSMWRQIGVDVTVDGNERGAATKRMFGDKACDCDASMIGYQSFGDPALGMARAFVTSAIGKQTGNGSSYSNTRVDELFEKAEHATAREDRGIYYKQVQGILADELPMLTLHERVLYDAMNKGLHGLEDEHSMATWRDAWLEK